MTIRLSPIDHMYIGASSHPIDLIFRFSNADNCERLRNALFSVISDFSPLRSTLKRVNRESFGFEERPLNIIPFIIDSVTDLPDMNSMPLLYSLMDHVISIPEEPLLKLKWLQTKKGAALLFVSMSHAAADGYSAFLFLNAWATAARGEKYIIPRLDRSALIPSPSQQPITSEIFCARTGYIWQGKRRSPGDESFESSLLKMSQLEFSTLLQNTRDHGFEGLSKNDILVAWLWKKFAPIWLSDNPKLHLSCAIDYRRHFAELGPLFFGNAVCGSHLEMDYSDFTNSSVVQIASKIRASIEHADLDYVNNFLSCLEAVRQQRGADIIEELDPAPRPNGFFVSNFSRFNPNVLNFGSGAPDLMRALIPVPRAVIVLPQNNSDVELQIQAPSKKV